MPTLAVWRRGKRALIAFEGAPRLWDALQAGGFTMARPCGGRGACGKCAVDARGALCAPNEAERRAGARLACQAVLTGDAEVFLPDEAPLLQIETGAGVTPERLRPMPGRLGAAIDVGTTTLALALYDLQTGLWLSSAAAANPQAGAAADVMGRISSALSGGLCALQKQATDALEALLRTACAQAGRDEEDVDALCVAGNTTMLYLLCGRDPTSLSRAPFAADCLFDEEVELLGRRAYLPPCAHAFVGADFVCAALSTGLCRSARPALLCDAGTNGELGLWSGSALYVASTAAGPAFEGAGISCGMGSVEGAIDRAWAEGGRVGARVIGGGRAKGVCGSGLVDAVAALLSLGELAPDGAAQGERLPLCDGVCLQPSDVRAVQLAKAAIAAGIDMLLESARLRAADIGALYLAGGFGSRVDIRSAAAIGLFPRELAPRATAVGNAAIDGAARLLLDTNERASARRIAREARHVELGGDARFEKLFISKLSFPAAN